MHLLYPNEAVKKDLAHLLNYGNSCNLMDPLEEILRNTNNYAKHYMKMQDVVASSFNGTAVSFGRQVTMRINIEASQGLAAKPPVSQHYKFVYILPLKILFSP